MPILMDSDENPIEVTDGGAAEIFRLRKQNDRLRAERDAAMRETGPALAKIGTLAAENERLREALLYARERLDALDDMDECMTLTDMRMIDEALGEQR